MCISLLKAIALTSVSLFPYSEIPDTDIAKERILPNAFQIMPIYIPTYVSVQMMTPFCMWMTFIFLSIYI